MEPQAATLRQLRILHGVFSFTVLMYVWVTELAAPAIKELSKSFFIATLVMAVGVGCLAYFFRRSRVLPAVERLRLDLNNAAALKQWRSGTILTLVLSESISLFGVELRFLGGSRPVSRPFFAVSLVLMLAWWPQYGSSREYPGSTPIQ